MPTRRSFLISSAALPLAAQAVSQTSAQIPEQTSALPPSLAALKNRAHEAVPITAAERQRRIDRARELMVQQRVAALALSGGTSLVYFTGIRSGVSERMFAWILPASGSPYIVCPMFEEARMTEQLGQMPEGSQTKIYTWNEDEDPYALLTEHLPHPGPLALDEKMPFVYADRIAKADPWRKVVSGIPISAGCRAIKSPAELALMQLANDITLSVYKAAWQAGAPGMTTAQFTSLVQAGFAQCGVSGSISCQTGEWSALPHGSVKPQAIRESSIVLIDDGCTVEGYASDISRTFVYGKATDRQKKVFDVVHAAQAKALATGKAGQPCHAVDDAARKVVTDAGFGPDYKTFSHRLGHGIGMDGHEWPYLVRGNNQPLEVGMCFSNEPGIYLPGEFGVRLEDDWHITPEGGVMFTPISNSLERPFD